MPRKKRATGISRAPSGPPTRTTPSRARRQAGSSAAGSARATLPPMVPRARMARWPTWGMACAMSRRVTSHERRVLHRLVPGQSTDDERLALHGDAVEAGQAIDVDEGCGRGQSHVERGYETLPAGEDAAVRPVTREQGEGFVE